MKKIAFIIPAYNEEKVIFKTIESILKISDARDIYLIDDGSTDHTASIAKYFTKNVVSVNHRKGKAYALNYAINYFKLTENYEYIMPMDADTRITKNFLKHALPILEKDVNKEYVSVVGKVIGRGHNWVTLYRLWEYEISQAIHKSAQAIQDSILICPGCATIFRSDLFKKVSIPEGTLTEDMDLTFLIHREKLGKIAFSNKAYVITQDPRTLKEFIKQIDRWYTGFWQCINKHNIPWEGQLLDLEGGMLALEGLFNGVLVLSFIALLPLVIFMKPLILVIPFCFDFFLFLIPTMLYTSWRHRIWRSIYYIPHIYLLRLISSMVFLRSFAKAIFVNDFQFAWSKILRY